jgi:hypothetical protein
MKKGNLRTIRQYQNGGRTQFGIEIRVNGVWRRVLVGPKQWLVFDLEYDCCARMLSFFEKDSINFKVGADAK